MKWFAFTQKADKSACCCYVRVDKLKLKNNDLLMLFKHEKRPLRSPGVKVFELYLNVMQIFSLKAKIRA